MPDLRPKSIKGAVLTTREGPSAFPQRRSFVRISQEVADHAGQFLLRDRERQLIFLYQPDASS